MMAAWRRPPSSAQKSCAWPCSSPSLDRILVRTWREGQRTRRSGTCFPHCSKLCPVSRDPSSIRATYDPRVQPQVIVLNRNAPVLLGRSGVSLYVAHHVGIVESDEPSAPWHALTSGYVYPLGDTEGRELVAFHWHPSAPNIVTNPHLHLGPIAKAGHQRLAVAHIPTGRVSLQDVLRLAITELGVSVQREDWDDVLQATRIAAES